MNPILENLFKAIDNLDSITNDEASELLEQEGHDLNVILSETAQLKDKLQRLATMKLAIAKMTPNQMQAISTIALALHLDSGPDYRSNCQMAFMKLLNLDSYNWQDPEILSKSFLELKAKIG